MTPLEEAAKAFHFFTDFTLDEATEFLRGYPLAENLDNNEWD